MKRHPEIETSTSAYDIALIPILVPHVTPSLPFCCPSPNSLSVSLSLSLSLFLFLLLSL